MTAFIPVGAEVVVEHGNTSNRYHGATGTFLGVAHDITRPDLGYVALDQANLNVRQYKGRSCARLTLSNMKYETYMIEELIP